MLWPIAKKELSHHLRGFRFWAGALLGMLLAAGATAITAHDYAQRLSGYADRLATLQRELRTVSTYSNLQPVLLRPPEPLSILDQGLEPRLGTEVAINIFTVPAAATGEQRSNEFLISLPVTDLTLVVSLVLGLLALLLTCDSITGEKDAGTLRAIFAAGVARWTVLLGKFAGNLLTIGLALACTMAVSLAILAAGLPRRLTGDEWLRVGGLAVSYLVYLSLMLWCGILVSLRAPNTSRALGLSMLLGLMLTILIPGVGWAVATDPPRSGHGASPVERQIARLAAERDRRWSLEFRRSQMRSVPSGYTATSVATRPVRGVRYRNGSAPFYDALAEYYRLETASGLAYAAWIYSLRQDELGRRRAAERLGTVIAALSPVSGLHQLTGSFAGTSAAHFDRFLAACRGYRARLVEFLQARQAFASWRWFTDDSPGDLHPWPAYLGLRPEQVAPEQMSRLFSRLGEPAVEARSRRDRQGVDNDPTRRLALDDLPAFSFQTETFAGCMRREAGPFTVFLLLDGLAAGLALAQFRRLQPD